jgi:hypothetical protein
MNDARGLVRRGAIVIGNLGLDHHRRSRARPRQTAGTRDVTRGIWRT